MLNRLISSQFIAMILIFVEVSFGMLSTIWKLILFLGFCLFLFYLPIREQINLFPNKCFKLMLMKQENVQIFAVTSLILFVSPKCKFV